MKKKIAGMILCLILIAGGYSFLNAEFTTDYRIIKNPNKRQAVNYQQAKYLMIFVQKPLCKNTKIKILLKLVELFQDEVIEFEDDKKMKLKKVISDLKVKGRGYMAEFYDQDDNERAWVWFEG